MSFFRRMMEAIGEAIDRGEGTAKKTLCCGVLIHDLWMHTEACPQRQAAEAKFKAWRAKNPDAPITGMPREVPVLGDTSGMCPDCGFPTGHYGIYTVGEKCSWCGYVEKRRP